MSREEEIQKNMKLLKISREEAEQLYIDDHSDEILPEVAELEKKAKQIKHYESTGKPRKKAVKERKVDEEKKRILADVKVLLEGLGCEITNVKNEAEISFCMNEVSYSIKLIKHRPKKD